MRWSSHAGVNGRLSKSALLLRPLCLFFLSHVFQFQVDLDVTLPGDGGKDRPFKVTIRFVSLVSWHMLHEVLTGCAMSEPVDLEKPISTNPVHAVDVVLRHLPSMK